MSETNNRKLNKSRATLRHPGLIILSHQFVPADKFATDVRATQDLGVAVYALVEHLDRRWFRSETRKRTTDGDRMDRKAQWIARGVRLFIYLRVNSTKDAS